ncbi:MAG: hypothetical protein HQL06_03015 [Nitrospirae bacterium]|uniref:Magnetosome protein Man6 n=1 Tax=uncultured Nitrospirota bacterium TaxID=170969 RepID=A0A142BTX9_9BACT|nr:magnetosome protein Man6 [uncultured Nitrospirota bacterium]MBF0343178.1 hypothetical protein [Nitrospirota bacterium]
MTTRDYSPKETTYSREDMIDLIGNVVHTLVIKKQIIVLKSEIAKKIRDVQSLQDKVDTVRKRSTELKTIKSDMEKKIVQSRESLKSYNEEKAKVLIWIEKLKEFENTQGLIEDKKMQVQTLTDSVHKLYERFKTLERSYKEISKLKHDILINVDEKTKIVDKLSNEIYELQQQKDKYAGKPYLTMDKSELTAMQEKTRKKIKGLQQDIRMFQDMVGKHKAELTLKQAKLAEVNKEIERLSASEKDLKEKIAYYSSIEDKDVLLADIDSLKKQRITIMADLADKQRKLQGLEASIKGIHKSIEEEKHFTELFEKRKLLLKEKKQQVEELAQKLSEQEREATINERKIYLSEQINGYIGAVNELLSAEIKGIDKHLQLFEEAAAK